MPPSVKTETDQGFNQGQGFPPFNASRRRQPPPKLKKPASHYRHLVRWNKNQIPESIEEQQMNQDLVLLRQALDLFLNSHMVECEEMLAKGPIPVTTTDARTNPTAAAAASTAAAQKAAEALGDLKLEDSKKNQEEEDNLSNETSSSASSNMGEKNSSSGSSTESGKKGDTDKATPKAMYYELGKGIVQGFKALLTFNPEEIELGMKAFDQAIKTANKQRKGTMIGLGSAMAVGSFVMGTIGAGSFRSMNRVQKHAELIYAEATILRSLLSVLYHIDLWMVFEECINLRHAFTIIQGLKSFMDSVESELRAGKNIDRHQIDEHLVSGVTLSYSLYNIIISFLPEFMVKMLQFIGFPSDRDWGMAMLSACGDWDPMAPPDTPAEHAERLASSANDGIRRQFCDMVPVIFQVIVSSFIPMNHIDLSYAQMINDYNLERFPESPFFLFFKGRHLQITSKLDQAVEVYNSVKVQPQWHNLNHILVFEEMMCAMMQADHDTACEKSRQLLKESRWSKCTFRYLTAITGYERGKQSEKKKIDNLMVKVEDGMQKVAGMNIFFETFCARKSKRFEQEGRLLLPCYDFMLLWNTFDMMPPKVLQKALVTISAEVRRLQAMLPQKMKDREDQPLATNDQTIEAFSGGYLSSMFSNKNAILKDSKVENYENFYDDYCLAFFLQGLVAYHIAFFPEEEFNRDMCELALESFHTVFRYAPLIKDDTYTYYFSHYYKAKIWIHQGRLDEARTRFRYLLGLSNTNLLGLPALVGGKGRNSLELFVLLKVHSGLLDIETAKAAIAESQV
ncbi:hypothetical protein EDD21DRAFT_6252 [Dissophora ornata]|nr:hypothetical protein BGZ58_000151 [Dissophora ornata]KAI8596374.1 hypothetical protein EDD21DRAFT_6252 [Dissophora ornata]